jgi:ketosteroid isomerase-like protein
MSQENVELVRRGFEAFNRGGEDARVSEALLASDVVWEVQIGVADFDGVYHGRPEVRRFWRTFFAELEELRIEVEELVDCGDRVFCVTRVAGRGRQSHATGVAGGRTFPVFTLRDGLVVRYQVFAERQKALEAAGLSE